MIVSEKLNYEGVQGFKYGYSLIGKPKLHAYFYYIDGLLIDTGQPKTRSNILADTIDLKVDQIFITHHHEDHSGNILEFQERHQCKVYGSEACSKLMKNPPKLSFAQKITWGDRPPYHDIIPIEGSIKTPNYTFEIIPIPGHAIDMVALYEPNKKWLFSADLFLNTYIGYFIDNESIAAQIASIKRVLELDFDVMFCSHNPQLNNPKKKLIKKLDFLERTFNDVAALYNKGYNAKQVFKALKWKENWFIKALSSGHLSKMNMIKAIIRDLEN